MWSEGVACNCLPARFTKPGVRMQDVELAKESVDCLRRSGLLREMQCGKLPAVLVGNWSSAKEPAAAACAALNGKCTVGAGSGVAWQPGETASARARNATTCAFLAFHHIDKAGGSSIREWMKQLELGPDGFEFLSAYSPRSCLAAHPRLGVVQCGDMSTQRRVMHEALDGALRCRRADAPAPRFRLMSEYHAYDAQSNFRAMAHRLPQWRPAAARLGCVIRVVALVREPSRWCAPSLTPLPSLLPSLLSPLPDLAERRIAPRDASFPEGRQPRDARRRTRE